MSLMAKRKIAGWSWLAGMFAVLLGASAIADEPWKQLPPTPHLPPHTIGRHLEVNGARIWYAEWGSGRHGTPVLLLHGGFANSDYFGNLIPVLIQNGYRVIAMDSRGHGRSGRTNQPLTYHLMASDVIGVLDSLKIDKVAVVGWSDGGCIGYDLGVNHPERLARLFTFGANADVSGLEHSDNASPVFSAYWSRVQEEYRRLSPTPDDWQAFSADTLRMWKTLPAFTAGQLASITAPTTIADGQYDDAIKLDHLKYIVATIPHAKLVILPNLGHLAMLQGPSAFNAAVLDFLQDYKASEAPALH
jgi:pimeloyl-ACP methyl ester carboxylesterase